MSLRNTLHALHVSALGLWSGGLIMTAAAAAVVFPTMKELNPSLPAYSGYTGDHWLVAAGHVAAKVFMIADVLAFICAFLAALTMLIGPAFAREPWRRKLFMTRACVLGLAICLLSYHLLILSPRMHTNLRGYWDNALAGKTAIAEPFRHAFTADHPTSQNIMASTCFAVLLGMFLGALDRGEVRQPS